MASDTLRHAIETGVEYQNLSGAMVAMVMWSAGPEGDGFVLRADLPDSALDPTVGVFLVEEAFSSVVTPTRLAIGAAFAPRLVEFAFSRPAGNEPVQ